MTAEPLKVAEADVKVLATDVMVTSVPYGPEAGVIVLDGTGEQSPVPSTTKVYGFSLASLLAIETVAVLTPA